MFLEGFDGELFETTIKNRLKGECLFWRAGAYFRMVKAYAASAGTKTCSCM